MMVLIVCKLFSHLFKVLLQLLTLSMKTLPPELYNQKSPSAGLLEYLIDSSTQTTLL